MAASEKDPPPHWSFTWLLRVQRQGRKRRPDPDGDGSTPSGFSRWFPWAVLLMLGIEIGVLVWLGVLPR